MPDSDLLAYGVPCEWLADVKAATEDTVLGLADHLPAEASEALLELATVARHASQRGRPELGALCGERSHPLITRTLNAASA